MKRHWSRLPGVRGYTRVPDEVGTGRRLLRCDACGRIIPSLGVGYHEGGGQASTRPCTERDPDRAPQPVPDWPKPYVALGPVYGPPLPTAELTRRLDYEAHKLLPTEECDSATTVAGCIWHPAPYVRRAL